MKQAIGNLQPFLMANLTGADCSTFTIPDTEIVQVMKMKTGVINVRSEEAPVLNKV